MDTQVCILDLSIFSIHKDLCSAIPLLSSWIKQQLHVIDMNISKSEVHHEWYNSYIKIVNIDGVIFTPHRPSILLLQWTVVLLLFFC